MENGSDTQKRKKKVLKTCVTVLAVLLGLAATPFVFLWAFHHAAVFTMWGYGEDPDSGLCFFLPALGAIVFGIAWSLFTVLVWRRGNIGLRVGVSAVVWAFVLGVTIAYWGRCLIVSF